MASSSFTFRETLAISFIVLISVSPILRVACELSSCEPPLKSIISFGDSLADTGNDIRLSNTNTGSLPPYGQTYFQAQTGRCSDGRLIIDFLAQYLGLPLVPPYIGSTIGSFYAGVNFAVAGATALDKPFFEERGVDIPVRNGSLATQLSWFKDLLPSLCQTSSDCGELFQRSLFLVGEIGGNDYNHALLAGVSMEVVETFVSPVVDAIVSTVDDLIDLGASTLVVPGNFPIGCSVAYLTTFMTNSSTKDYDPQTGCLNWLNDFAMHHNTVLKTALARIQESHPHATIIYADYYNAAMQLFRNPDKFGFSKGAITACCGANGPYHYDASAMCGQPSATVCEDSSLYVNWDGIHLTEAAYNFIFQDLFEGPHTIPPFSSLCTAASHPQYL
ncbi:Sinapine esterase [Heracleum sosnowskyi]|uniref:Sinapine esterase n=1 Tax=Heracleum sosnowskyi TaxID=360622 RepID=A0AAD8HL47_9APIA|nr:Sinapine esterase [Heracleum sosnowskyi]